MVNDPDSFEVQPDGSIIQHGYSVMLPESYVFNAPHAGQELSLSEDIPKEDLAELEVKLKEALPSAGSTASLGMYCRKARESTSRAIMFNGCAPGLGFRGGLANFSMLCLSEPDYVHRLHEILARHCIEKLERLLPAIWPSIDILMLSSDDQGTQSDSILPPPVFRELFVPYYKAITDSCRKLAPNLKIFLHSCGAIYPLLDDIADCGFDVLNPVQWTAGGHSYLEWKDRCRKRLAFWGGGVNSQTTLPLGSVDDVRREVSQIVPVLAKDSGYIFCNIHNLLAEIAPEKIIAMYQAAGACKY